MEGESLSCRFDERFGNLQFDATNCIRIEPIHADSVGVRHDSGYSLGFERGTGEFCFPRQ